MNDSRKVSGNVLPKRLLDISAEINRAGGSIYVVGGWVRDYLLDEPSHDYDLEVYGLDMEKLFNILVRHAKPNLVGKSFGIITMRIDGLNFDFAFPRTENKTGPGHKGFAVTPDPYLTFEAASSRRDFTINSMGIKIPEMELVDCHNGHRDLQAKVLRHVSDAFSEDPLRVLRAVQFAARFELDIAPETQELCRNLPLAELPMERIYGEFKKLLLKARRPSLGLEWMRKLGLLKYFPELEALIGVQQEPEWHPEGDVWIHNNMVIDEAAKLRRAEYGEFENMALMLGALCHDFGKPLTTVFSDGRWRSPAHDARGEAPTRAFLDRLTHESALVETVVAYVREHLKPALLYKARAELKPSAIRRLALRVDIEKLVRVARADHFGRTTPDALAREFPAGEWLLEQSRLLNVLDSKPKPYLTGKFLLSLGMKPGPEVGRLIAESFELQLEGDLEDVAAAESWARARLLE
ncbi:MAG TPA: polynucleotide adenylyltransferase [Fibrobacteria bacterium]|nr:polynucleotide adenylyltransferase [Fibrobacteria bacterium]